MDPQFETHLYLIVSFVQVAAIVVLKEPEAADSKAKMTLD